MILPDLEIEYINFLPFAAIIIIAVFVIAFLVLIFRSPFRYPYFIRFFDVSGKRKPRIEDFIDNFIIVTEFDAIQEHNKSILIWKQECQDKIKKSKIMKLRQKQFNACLDDANAFKFYLTRKQTRYKQQNYVRMPYKVTQPVDQFSCSYTYLKNRNEELKMINYECTLQEWHSKNQRKLMTKELREKIMIRDKYTCQKCGKYMPDKVGLHIDHIIPVSKGGKTVLSNLQVLCSKCNGSKSNII